MVELEVMAENNSQISLRKLSGIATAVLSVLLIAAICFYKQRILFVDPAFIAFSILNQHSFLIIEYRYGAFITQMVPLLSSFLHLSLKNILLAYSVSFNLFYLIVALLLCYRYKQFGLAILMAFYFTLFVSDAYFWTNNEVHQGISWMFLCFGSTMYMAQKQKKTLLFVPFILFSFLAIFSHFLVIIPFSFLWFFFWIGKNNWPFSKQTSVILTLVWIIVFIVKYYLGFNSWYDGGRLHNATHFNLHDIILSITSDHAKKFISLIFTAYWLVILLFAAGIVALLKDKKYILASLTAAYCLGYFIALSLTFGGFGKELLFYMESEWMGLGIIAATPFVYSFLPRLKLSSALPLLSAIFLIRLVYIACAAPAFINRIKFIEAAEQKMTEKGYTKIIIKRDSRTAQTLIMDWGAPVESLFFSAIKNDKPQLTFAVVPQEELSKVPRDNKTFLSCFSPLNDSELNKEYFHFDTTRPYKILSYDELMK